MVLYNQFLLIRLFVNYLTFTGVASQFIDKLTWEIRERYIAIAEAFSFLGVSPESHRQSPSFRITKAEATSLSNKELHKGHVNSLSDKLSFTSYLQFGHTPVIFTNLLPQQWC